MAIIEIFVFIYQQEMAIQIEIKQIAMHEHKNLRCSFSKVIYRTKLKNTKRLIMEYIHIIKCHLMEIL